MAGARIFVCRSIIGIGPRTAGLIGIWEALFDLPEQRKDYGDDFRVTSGLWHVARAILQTLAKIFSQACRPKQWTDSTQTWCSDSHYQGCRVGVETAVGVGRSRSFRPESESELESVKFYRLRLRPGVASYHPSTYVIWAVRLCILPKTLKDRKKIREAVCR